MSSAITVKSTTAQQHGYSPPMPVDRWASLFADLEALAAAEDDLDLAAEVADRSRAEAGRIRLVDRFRAAQDGSEVALHTGPEIVRGRVADVGPDWVLLAVDDGVGVAPVDVVVRIAALTVVDGLSARAAEPGSEGTVAARFDLRALLRGIARDRSPVGVTLTDGSRLQVRLERVGADHVDVTDLPTGTPRTVPIAAVGVLRRT